MPIQKIDISTSTIFRTILIILAIIFLYYIVDILVLVFIAFVIVSAVSPLVDKLEKYKIPRAVSTALIYVLGFMGMAYLLTLIVPPLFKQTSQLVAQMPHFWNDVIVNSWVGRLFGLEMQTSGHSEQLFKIVRDNFSPNGIFTKAGSFALRFFHVAVIFSLSFYMTIQKTALKNFIKAMLPKEHEKYVIFLVVRIKEKLGLWLQGQLLLNCIIGVLVYTALYFIGVPFALMLAIMAAFLEFIPNIGPTIATVISALVALTISPVMAILVLVAFIVIQQLENHLIVPMVMKQVVGLNPVVIIVAILIGIKLAGPIGVLIAVPLAAALSVFIGDLMGGGEEESQSEARRSKNAEKKKSREKIDSAQKLVAGKGK